MANRRCLFAEPVGTRGEGAGVTAVILLQALAPGAVFIEANLVMDEHGPAHGGDVALGQDQLEVGFGEGVEG